jgi:hypothetical protein
MNERLHDMRKLALLAREKIGHKRLLSETDQLLRDSRDIIGRSQELIRESQHLKRQYQHNDEDRKDDFVSATADSKKKNRAA